MKFAINYSEQAAALLAAGQIELDYFKCPDWPDLIARLAGHWPLAVHFNLKAGGGRMASSDWQQIEALLDRTGTPYVNLHLDPLVDDFPGFSVDTPDAAQFDAVEAQMLADLQVLVEHFGPQRVIAENVPYRGAQGRTLRPAVEPVVICRLLEETGCGLLLDISHARIAAHHLGLDEWEYMAQLPVHRLRELHFTGLHWREGRLQDHLETLPADWPVLDWVLERIRLGANGPGEWARPWMLAFEYGGLGEKFAWRSAPQVIVEQVPLLYQRLQNV